MSITDLLDKLDGVTGGNGHWTARCPAHPDQNPSLSVSEGDEQPIVVHCHAGCTPEAVMAALGLTLADLVGQPRIVASYAYTDLDGSVLYIVHRWSPKSFSVEPKGITDGQRVLYRRDVIEWARQTGEVLHVVEGEKDADRLHAIRVCATTAPHGASAKWLPQYTETLTGCNVRIIADNDAAGIAKARKVYAAVKDACASVGLVKPQYGNDVSDLLDAGYDLSHLEPISETAGLTVLRADEIEPERVRWAWPGYIPFGHLTLIDGDPGSAKSTLSVDLIARWTSGRPMPDGSEHPGPLNTILVSAEDDPATTIIPRLLAAGANRKRVELVTGGLREDLPFDLGVDLTALGNMVQEADARVVVLDPLTAFLPARTDTKMDADVRRVLSPLAHMARQLRFALVVVRHLTKGGSYALYAGSGSVGFIAAARAAYLVTADPTQSNEHRVLAPTKMNLARLPKSLSYTVEPSVNDQEVPMLHWHGEVAWTAQKLLDKQRGVKDAEDDTDLIREAKDWLRFTVTPSCLNGGVGMKWKEIVAQAKDEGEYSEATLRRARKGVLVKVYNPRLVGEVQKGVWWKVLPYDDKTAPAIEDLDLLNLLSAHERVGPDPFMSKEQVEQVAEPDEDPEPRTEEWLMAQPLVCDIPNCPAEGDRVTRYGPPHWCVRCNDHEPEDDPDVDG